MLRCAYLGINPKRIQIILMTVALAGVAGFAGFLFAHASGVVAPENTGFLFGTELVIWVALGGRGIAARAGDRQRSPSTICSASLSGDLPFLWQLRARGGLRRHHHLFAGRARRAWRGGRLATVFGAGAARVQPSRSRLPRLAPPPDRRRSSRFRLSRARSAASRCSRISTSRSARANSSASSARTAPARRR